MAKKRQPAGPAAAAARKKQRKGPPGAGFGERGKPAKDGKGNVFETLWSRKKFDVLGKKHKRGERKRVGHSRSVAVEKRKKTLLHEYKQQGKGNVFLDRRFGEADEGLTEGDRAILRFQKERQAQTSRRSKFVLPDNDEEEEEILTHGGLALDDFNDDDSLQNDDGEDMAELDEDAVRNLNFGGGFSPADGNSNEPQQPKSKKEVMEDLIAKSKYYKAQKAKEKEEDEELKEKLDNDFSELVKSGAPLSLRNTRRSNIKSPLSQGAPMAENAGRSSAEQDKPDEFDKLIKEMVFDIRGHAGERLKTAEERAKEERERLEKLEEKRRERMVRKENSDEENEGSDDDNDNRRRRKKKRIEISGDDLGENFLLDDEEKNSGGWVDEVLAKKGDNEASSGEDESGDEDGSDEEEDEEEDDEEDDEEEDNGEKDDEEDDDISIGSHSSDQRSEEEDQESLPGGKKTLPGKKDNFHGDGRHAQKEVKKMDTEKLRTSNASDNSGEQDALPYVINAPQTLGDFRAIVDHRCTEDLEIAIRRIRTCNAISLAAENRRKMQIFYNVLLQYFGSLAMHRPVPLNRINLVTKPLIELSAETPYFAAHCARQRVMKMHDQLRDKLRTSDGGSSWPSLRGLLLLRFWSMIFPPSDFRHPVMTPSILLMAEYLMRCQITTAQDLVVGSFLCTLLLSVLREARRFCPEVLTFILALLISALPMDTGRRARSLCPAFMVELMVSNQWLQLKGKAVQSENCYDLDFFSLMTLEASAPEFNSDGFRCGILQSILLTLKGFVGLYGDIVSFPEAFSPLLQVLESLGKEVQLPERVQHLRSEVAESIKAKLVDVENLRQPLRMRMKKPTPIKQFNPKFEENFMKGRNYDPDRERAEKKKLQRQVKREARGAARELRKDNYFLLEEKSKEKAVFEEERKEKYGKAMQFLQEQESAFKSGQLGKRKGKKRR